jgi:hypothetical protein
MATLQKWMPTYIQELEHQRNLPRGRIPSPKVYTTRNNFSAMPDERMPLCVVVSPGLAHEPWKDGEGRHMGWYGLGVGIVARANSEEASNKMAKIYGAAIRAIMLQKQALDDSWAFVGTELIDESFTDIPTSERERSMRSVQVIFRVQVDELVTSFAGPQYPIAPDPDTQPGSVWPEFQTADVVVQMKEES